MVGFEGAQVAPGGRQQVVQVAAALFARAREQRVVAVQPRLRQKRIRKKSSSSSSKLLETPQNGRGSFLPVVGNEKTR